MREYQIIIDDFIGRWGYSKQYIRYKLDQLKGKHVDIRISSLGGDLDHGLDIYNQLKDHGDVTVYLTGFVASAATIIAMGAKKVCMSKYAFFLVHKCSNLLDIWGNYNADQIEKLIDKLEDNKKENDKIDLVIAQLYSKRTGMSTKDLMNVLKEGKWLSAQEALDYGFVDELTDEEGEKKLNLTPELHEKFNAFNLTCNGLEETKKVTECEQKSFLQGLKDFFSLTKSNDKEEAKEDVEEKAPTEAEEPIINQKEQKMVRVACFNAVMASLNVKDLPVNEDGTITLSQEEMGKMDQNLRELEAKVNAKETTIKELNAKVENLKKLPADETKENLDDTGKADMSEDEMYNLARNFF